MSSAKLQDRVAIITGAASGIGRGVAELFSNHGAKIIIADIDAEAGSACAAELGDQVCFKQTDVTSDQAMQDLVNDAVNKFGRLDIMHNNAGAFGVRGSLLDIAVDDFDATFALLTRSVFLGMKHAAQVMKEQGSGIILNTASISAITPGYGPHIYQAAKAAVLQLSKTIALELAQYDIRVNCISPGGVYTPLISNMLGIDEEGTANVEKYMASTLPLGRTGTPADIAQAALFLCSEEASYITGQNLVVDGAEATGKRYQDQGMH